MNPITATDIIDFHNGRADLLALTETGEFTHLDYNNVDGRADAYSYTDTEDGEVQILLERTTITDGEWFPDALDDDGNLIPSIAQEMAAIINQDGILPSRAAKAVEASKRWTAAVDHTNALALTRAAAVAEVVDIVGGNQSEAARVLGLDQSTVNKLVKKASTANPA
jgi:hypothetical protein